MIPGLLGALQRAELPEWRVARGRPWCRRVEVLQQVLPNSWLTSSVRGSQREFSPMLVSSPSSPSWSRSTVHGDAQWRPSVAPNLRTESPGAAGGGCIRVRAMTIDADVLPVLAFATLVCHDATYPWTRMPPSLDTGGPTTFQLRTPVRDCARACAAAATIAQRDYFIAAATRPCALCLYIKLLAYVGPDGLVVGDIPPCVRIVRDMFTATDVDIAAMHTDSDVTTA